MPQPKKHPPKPYAPAPGEVASEARRAGFALARTEAEGLSRYLTLLLKWNRAMNLVGRAGWPEVFRDLAADSLHLAAFLRALDLPERPLALDLGAGAGLPGIPLRLVWGVGDYLLVELREKRAVFLRQAVGELREAGLLAGVRVFHGRAEDSAAELARLGLRERADLVLSRAFMPWPRLLPLAAGLLAPGGRLVVLANEPPPAKELRGEAQPGPDASGETGAVFAVEAALEYPSGEKTRYFWSLTPARA